MWREGVGSSASCRLRTGRRGMAKDVGENQLGLCRRSRHFGRSSRSSAVRLRFVAEKVGDWHDALGAQSSLEATDLIESARRHEYGHEELIAIIYRLA